MDNIPFVEVQPTQLSARADGRFGLEDYAQFPQAHSEAYPWAACVLKKPSPALLEDDPHWYLWEDITVSDWIHPPGASWQGTGVLRDAWRRLLHDNLHPIGVRALAAARHGTLPESVAIAVHALNATLARLFDLPMSYRDLVLQFTQAQRLGLDLLAMEAYHCGMFPRMMQRQKVYPIREEFIGCHTNNPTIVENMLYAGIPVVYIRPSNLIVPSQVRVRRVLANFAPVPEHIVTAQWPNRPCKVLHDGASSTRRFQMSRPHGRYFEDLIPLPDNAEPAISMVPFLSVDPLSRHAGQPNHPAEDNDNLLDFAMDSTSEGPSDFSTAVLHSSLPASCSPRKRVVLGGSSKQPRKLTSRKSRKNIERELFVALSLCTLSNVVLSSF